MLAFLTATALVRVFRSGQMKDRHHRFGGALEIVLVRSGVPAPRIAPSVEA